MIKAIAASVIALSLIASPALAGQQHHSSSGGAAAGGGTANASVNHSGNSSNSNVNVAGANAQTFTGISVKTGGAKSTTGSTGGGCWGWGC